MAWRVDPARFALIGFADPPRAEELEVLGAAGPAQVIREGGETTILAPVQAVRPLLAARPEARLEEPLIWVRFDLAMDWSVVGFLALVTGTLAEAGVPVGAVCGFSRDHLFVAEAHWPAAETALTGLFGPPSAD